MKYPLRGISKILVGGVPSWLGGKYPTGSLEISLQYTYMLQTCLYIGRHNFDVPQGTVLGLFWFLINVVDIGNVVQNIDLKLFDR
jgi:hypothetical protein